MNKNKKSIIFLGFIAMMTLAMVFVYANFLADKPYIDAQNKQAQAQNNLTPDQAINGIKNFIQTNTQVLKQPPPLSP